MEQCECPICKSQAECKEPNNLVVICPICGTFVVTLFAMRYFFKLGRPEENDLKRLQKYVQEHKDPIPVLSTKTIAEVTGVGTEPNNEI